MAAAACKNFLRLARICVDLDGHKVLHNIDLSVEQQEIVSLIGPNGAGKTTLFNVICGQIQPTEGAVYFADSDITHWPAHRICHAGIARTFQIAKPFPEMTVLQNVLIGSWFGKKGKSHSPMGSRQSEDLLRLVQLSTKASTRAKDLTLSEQRRLEVARALATRPRLLLLDEMAAGLSPHAISEAAELVTLLRDSGLTIILIDHFLTLTGKVSNRLVALDQGEIIAEGKPAEVLQSSEVASAYLGERSARRFSNL